MNKKLKRPPLNELLEVAGVDTKNKKIIIEYENNVNVEDIPNILEKYLKEKKKHINSKLIGVRTDKYDGGGVSNDSYIYNRRYIEYYSVSKLW